MGSINELVKSNIFTLYADTSIPYYHIYPKNSDTSIPYLIINMVFTLNRECSGSVVECLTRDRGAAGSSLTGVTAYSP